MKKARTLLLILFIMILAAGCSGQEAPEGKAEALEDKNDVPVAAEIAEDRPDNGPGAVSWTQRADAAEIPVTDIDSIRIGQVENKDAGTGCTVFICENGMCAGLDVRGGGPASRESQLLNPLMAAQQIHAIVLSGGSAYGLDTANGVMEYLEEQGYGYDTGYALVPLVAQADIYDLSVGDPHVRPDANMGYEAAKKAFEEPNYRDGNYGAGCGATVGKIAGMAHDGYARSINPVHTSLDGDSIYAVSVGNVQADQDLIGVLAADVVSEAIVRAVNSAESAYGYPAASSL